MKLHSALQQHLSACCRAAGKPSITLNQLAPYDGLYQVYCSKKRDRVLSGIAADGCSRAATVHMSFGRDAYVKGARTMLASSDPDDCLLHSMYTMQTATVSRGDDLRARKFGDLATRTLSCVGELMVLSSVTRLLSGHKQQQHRSNWQLMGVNGRMASMCAWWCFTCDVPVKGKRSCHWVDVPQQ